MNLSDSVLLKRLLSYLPNPFEVLGIAQNTNFDKAVPVAKFKADDDTSVKDKRDEAYSLGRIRYFRDLFLQEKEVTPIDVDNKWSGFSPYSLVLLDGHHRLCGAILAGRDHVVASYSGEVEALRWLKGERASCPKWLKEG
jgi:hypothetical protein